MTQTFAMHSARASELLCEVSTVRASLPGTFSFYPVL
jgi:hypothetical protein